MGISFVRSGAHWTAKGGNHRRPMLFQEKCAWNRTEASCVGKVLRPPTASYAPKSSAPKQTPITPMLCYRYGSEVVRRDFHTVPRACEQTAFSHCKISFIEIQG